MIFGLPIGIVIVIFLLIHFATMAFVYMYLNEVLDKVNCVSTKRLLKTMCILPVVNILYYPIMLTHGIIAFTISCYKYIIEDKKSSWL